MGRLDTEEMEREMQVQYPKFSIAGGINTATREEMFTVIERKNGRVVLTKNFDNKDDAEKYVQWQIKMDRDFGMEN